MMSAQGAYNIASYRDRREVHSYEVIRGRGHGLQGHAQTRGPSDGGSPDANEPRGCTSARDYRPRQTEPPDSDSDYLEPVLPTRIVLKSFKIEVAMKLSTTFVLSFTFIITALVYSSNGEKKEKTCADVKLAEPVNETVEANNDGYVHVSFMLNTDNCQDSPDGLRLKISTCEERLPCSFCTIVVNGILCNVTDRSHTCQCLIYQQQMFVSLYKNISRSDKEIRLTVRLKDLTEETLTLVNISFVNATDASSVNRTGAGVELAGPADKTIEVNDDGYVHISCVLTTDKCTKSPEWFRLKISTFVKSPPSPFCTIVCNGSTCSLTDQSLTCHCLVYKDQKFVSVYKKIKDLDKVIILTLTDSSVKTETAIWLNVTRKEWIDSRNKSSLVNRTDTLPIETDGTFVEGQKVETLEFNINEEEKYHYLEICHDPRDSAVRK
ncbi:hypothetical protein C0Q70_12057 [Pomacea canaliculata]|uniref:Uncharacterized protein n=1 Tax=Pomacea canaliculata TaxID=400727 RepID=A0A2T7P0J2_POMCA|nr:hypothetical protein C0Q70_12057 [Pomacea canaliculata]